MFSSIIERFHTSRAVRRLNKSPVIQAGRQALNTIWTKNVAVTKDFSADGIKGFAEDVWAELIQIATAPDPRLANRDMLTASVLECSRFQVLVLSPPPEPDPTGLRGQRGISGELKSKLVELAERDGPLRSFLHGFAHTTTWNELWDIVLFRYRFTWARCAIFERVRYAVADVNLAAGKDWYRPFLAAQCASAEHDYRKSVGMPTLIDEREALLLGTFYSCVRRGDRYPDLN